jgi:hypothetical protein
MSEFKQQSGKRIFLLFCFIWGHVILEDNLVTSSSDYATYSYGSISATKNQDLSQNTHNP